MCVSLRCCADSSDSVLHFHTLARRNTENIKASQEVCPTADLVSKVGYLFIYLFKLQSLLA